MAKTLKDLTAAELLALAIQSEEGGWPHLRRFGGEDRERISGNGAVALYDAR